MKSKVMKCFLFTLVVLPAACKNYEGANQKTVDYTNINNMKEKVSSYFKDASAFKLRDFINMDLGIMAYFPSHKHWNKIERNITTVPVDSLRYVDSLDVKYMNDTLIKVKFYTQNYAYRSRNSYKISGRKSADTLKVRDIWVNYKAKDSFGYADEFRKKDFTVDYIYKQNLDSVDKRIVFNKNYLNTTE